MERKKLSATSSPLKRSPTKTRHSTGGFLDRIHGPHSFSLKALLKSIFSCSGSGEDWADDQSIYTDNSIKRPVVSPTRPPDAKKQKKIKHTTSSTPNLQIGSLIALNNASKKSKTDNNGSEAQIISSNDLSETKRQLLALPNISEPSTILSDRLRGLLYTHLPTLVQGREWVLVYSTWKHGISLGTLYRQSAHLSGPYLLAVEDSKGAVFGGLLTGSLNPTKKAKFQGTHESFVFTDSDTNFGLFRTTGLNRYYLLCTNDMLAIGGGGALALRLDSDLMYGSSGRSETFGNCRLSCTEEFSIRHVELWGFAHKSRKVLAEKGGEVSGIWGVLL